MEVCFDELAVEDEEFLAPFAEEPLPFSLLSMLFGFFVIGISKVTKVYATAWEKVNKIVRQHIEETYTKYFLPRWAKLCGNV